MHSSPKAKVEWFKNGRPLGEREGHISTRGNKHSLHLFSMKEQTFGTYSCRAENKLGMDEKSTQVSGELFLFSILSIHIHKRESPEISKFYKSRFEGCGPPRKVNKGSMDRSFYVDCP